MDIMWVPAYVRDVAARRVLPTLSHKEFGIPARESLTLGELIRDTIFVRGLSAIVFPSSTAAQLDPAISQPTRNKAVLAGPVLFFVSFLLFVWVGVGSCVLHWITVRSWRV